MFIRIHEKPKLDYKSDVLAVIYLTGCHIDETGNSTADMNAPFEIFENVTGISLVCG